MIGYIIDIIKQAFSFFVKRNDMKQQRADSYQTLVQTLNAPLPGQEAPFLDNQKTAIFQMRNYPEFKENTTDILQSWVTRDPRLCKVVDDTLDFLNK